MKTVKINTSLKCNGCEATVRPHIDAVSGIQKWSVDLSDPKKTITVEGENFNPEEIVEAIRKAGYKAEIAAG